jgi:hypothetical protein
MLQERSYDKGDYGLTNSLSLPLFEMFKAMSGGGREGGREGDFFQYRLTPSNTPRYFNSLRKGREKC